MFLSSSVLAIISLLEVSLVYGGDLVPIRPSHGNGNSKRDTAALDLKSAETFLWGDAGVDDFAIANLTVEMPGDGENILSMEQFDGMLTSIHCNADNLALTFEDDDTFAYAQQVWDWVNGADNHSFVMVAGVGDCGNNTQRIPYVISSIAYDEEANLATLAATQSNWTAIAHTYDLTVGQISNPSAQFDALRARDIDKTSSIDFVHQFPFSFAISSGALEAKLACTNCSSTGSFDMELHISTKLFVPTGAKMELAPRGVSAIGQVKLSGSGSLTDPLIKEFDILSIPLAGIKIPEILELGPFLTVSVGAELSSIALTASVQAGATAKLDDAAIMEVDLLNPEENSFSGWEPTIDAIDVRVDASISGGVAVFLKPAVELKAEALGFGFEIGLNLRVPNINARLAAIVSPQGACPTETPLTTTGVSISTNIGCQFNIEAKKIGESDPLFTVQIATIDKPLAAVCFPFGDPIEQKNGTLALTRRRHRYMPRSANLLEIEAK